MARGDHIRARRFGYWHHGIDCGDGTAIHFAGEAREKKHAKVRRTPLADFAKGAAIRTVRHKHSSPPESVVTRAESRLGDTSYNMIRNNCEHFAHWCSTGVKKSVQVEKVAATTGVVACMAGVAIVVAARHRASERRRLG